MVNVLRSALVLGCFAAVSSCGGHHHGYHELPPPLDYRHYHRLDCEHFVECRYFDGAHHYVPHRQHDRYWHVHRTDGGRYERCYVVRKRHDY